MVYATVPRGSVATIVARDWLTKELYEPSRSGKIDAACRDRKVADLITAAGAGRRRVQRQVRDERDAPPDDLRLRGGRGRRPHRNDPLPAKASTPLRKAKKEAVSHVFFRQSRAETQNLFF